MNRTNLNTTRAAACAIALSLLAGCAKDGLELSVDLRTDWQPGRQFVGVIVLVGSGLGADFVPLEREPQQAVATETEDFLEGVRIADLDGLTPGEHTVRVELLTAEGDVLVASETLVDLRGSYALTVLMASSCGGVLCPGPEDSPEAVACFGGRCVDPRCSPETPEFCGPSTCASDADCTSGVECTRGACIEGECLLRADHDSCSDGFVCDLLDGCTLATGVDGGPACPPTELDCEDGVDDDCDGLIDCADPDCESQLCDDGSLCTEGDTCSGGICGGAALDCDDGNPCTDDTCDPGTGCASAPNTAACDDGSWCNGADTCRDGACTEHGAPPCADFCNESTMACEMCAGDGDCGAPMVGAWSSCGGFSASNTCDETGTRSRQVSTPRCSAGACSVEVTTEMEACTRDRDGVRCGDRTFGSWGSCGGFGGACNENGTQTRNVTTPTCRGGSCVNVRTQGERNCSRTVRNGKSCGTDRVCCGNSCVNIRSNQRCGACGVDCSAQGLVCAGTGNGGVSCRGCSSNSQCRAELNSAATCFDTRSPPSFCQCQCPSNGVCANGGCGANFFCHDIPGHNFCSPTR